MDPLVLPLDMCSVSNSSYDFFREGDSLIVFVLVWTSLYI